MINENILNSKGADSASGQNARLVQNPEGTGAKAAAATLLHLDEGAVGLGQFDQQIGINWLGKTHIGQGDTMPRLAQIMGGGFCILQPRPKAA